MKLFGTKSEVSNQKAKKIELEKEYDFMYESFILSSQRKLYLLLVTLVIQTIITQIISITSHVLKM